MPQNAIIKADGTGDYTTVSAWFAAESASNYGAPTRAYISGTVNAGGNIVFNTAGGNWPNGFELRAVAGQEYNGTNHTTCARINHTGSLLEFADTDADVQDLALGVTGGFNVEVIKSSNTVTTTQRRNITLKRLYVESPPSYHGSTYAIEFNAVSYASGAGSQYNLDFEDIVIYTRASNRGIYIAGRTDNGTFTGSVRRVTVLPTNSGTNVTNGFWLGTGNDSVVTIDKILSLNSQVISTVVDYSYGGLGGTQTNISTNDETGTVTGVTTATELENYAAGDYRLKTTGSGNGAFPQSVGPGAYSSDVSVSWPVISVTSSQSSTVPDVISDVSTQWPLFSALVSQSTEAAGVESNVSLDWPLFTSSASQQSDVPQYTSSANLIWPALLISADQISTLPTYDSDAQILWPLISFQASESSDLPAGSNAVAITWPIASISASQSSEVPEFSASLSFNWPIFNVNSSVDISDPVSGSAIEFSWPAISVLSDQSSVSPSYDLSASINWPMFSVYALSGEFEFSEDPKAKFEIPALSRRFDIPTQSRTFDI